jgi:four helix bundle protein
MASVKRFEDLDIWIRGREIVERIYRITKRPAFSKDFELSGHIRKTAISIPSNIAEGFERNGNKEFINFLSVAKGSCGELRSRLHIALDQDYIDQQHFHDLNESIIALTNSIGTLMNYLKKSEYKGTKFK